MDAFITPGEFAKLACTTKRTILFYDQKGVLKPERIDLRGFRYYSQRQILDYQMVLLLTTLGISLKEIKEYLNNHGKLVELFKEKRPTILKEMSTLEFNLKNIDNFLENLKTNRTMIKPKISVFQPLSVYYIDKIGAYSKIGMYCSELINMIEKPHDGLTTMAVFEDQGYRPKNCHIKICVFSDKDIAIKPEFKNVVRHMTFSPGKVISYKHSGAGEMLSLFWKELEKYCRINRIKVKNKVSDFEIYWKVNADTTQQVFEIFLPIE